MIQPRIAIILPALNEKETIQLTIRDFHLAAPGAEIYVVDNGSTDGTAEIARKVFAELRFHGHVLIEPRRGKANAMRRAFHEIQADVYVMADSDSTYLGKDLQKLLEPVLRGEADMTVGNRHANSTYASQNDRAFHNFGNNLVRRLINTLFKTQLQDIMTGYRVMTKRFVKNFPVLCEGFEIETEMTLHAVSKKFRVLEFPIDYKARPDGSESKLSTFTDGFRVLKRIFWIFKDYRPLFFFSVLSGICAITGLALGIRVIIEFSKTGLVLHFPTAILASALEIVSLLFFAIGLILDTVAKYNREQFELQLLRWNDRPKAVKHDESYRLDATT